MEIILYISNFNKIGGVESFVKNFYKRIGNVRVLYDTGTPDIGEKINFKQRYKCDIFIAGSAWGRSAFDVVDAKVYIQSIHADFRHTIKDWNFKYVKHPKTTHHVCVSETVKIGFEATTPHKCDAVMYNFVDTSIKPIPKKKNDILKLVTCSRISKEKGFERMIAFSKLIPVPFVWELWGDASSDYARKVISNFDFKGVTNEPHKEIAKADYLVQLSDTEGNSCVINEALQMQTPVLLTPFPSGFEQVENGVNGFFVPFDLSGIEWDSIINKIPKLKKYKEKTTVENWELFFDLCLEWYKENVITVKIIAVVQKYKIDEIVDLPKERALSAIKRGLAVLVE